jgi:hypothetical protein
MIDWNKAFPYGSITREDLRSLDIPEDQIALLTDEDMQAIAKKVGELYCDFGFWEDLRTAIEQVMEEKKQHE